ncbi:MAG: type II toxin-antitoxin system VapC family toxin [Gammaproteobacteria bacterium]
MNVVDSSAWLEFFADGGNAVHFARPIAALDRLVVPSITILEVFKRILQQRDENAGLRAVAAMRQGRVVALDADMALTAAKLGHDLKLPLADSVILATARKYDAVLWTQDVDFKGLKGVRYFSKA